MKKVRHILFKRGYLLLLPVIAGLAALACSLGSLVTPGAPLSQQSSPVGRPTSGSDAAGPFNIRPESVNDGLDKLGSYSARITAAFTGTRGSQPATGSIESLAEVTRRPLALHQLLKINAAIPGAGSVPGVSEFFWVDNKVYVKKGSAGPWYSFSSGQITPDQLGFFEPDRLIILPDTVAAPPRFANLAGRNIQQYSFNEDDLSHPNLIFEDAEGELWLTTIGNYIVRYEISAALRIIIPDPKAHIFDEGQLNLSYTLSDMDAPMTISPPPGALSITNSLTELPRLPDAEVSSMFPLFLEYTSAITPVGAALFYRDELLGLDWTEESLTAFNEKARLVYSKEGQRVTILINPASTPDKIKVSISLDAPP